MQITGFIQNAETPAKYHLQLMVKSCSTLWELKATEVVECPLFWGGVKMMEQIWSITTTQLVAILSRKMSITPTGIDSETLDLKNNVLQTLI
jgi:hypothetical protein